MPEPVQVRLVNHSDDDNNSTYVIIQKNRADSDVLPAAWIIIKNLGKGAYHPFSFDFQLEIAGSDGDGNSTEPISASLGKSFQMTKTNSGHQITPNGDASSPGTIELVNNLKSEDAGAKIFRNKKLLAHKSKIAPGQKAIFKFNSCIFIGTLSNIEEEGTILNSAIVSGLTTEVSLTGIASADIVITGGGGSGEDAKPFQFSLMNIVWAS